MPDDDDALAGLLAALPTADDALAGLLAAVARTAADAPLSRAVADALALASPWGDEVDECEEREDGWHYALGDGVRVLRIGNGGAIGLVGDHDAVAERRRARSRARSRRYRSRHADELAARRRERREETRARYAARRDAINERRRERRQPSP